MEDILNVYRMDYDKEIPLVCMDEQPVQLLDDKILPSRGVSEKKIMSISVKEARLFFFLRSP